MILRRRLERPGGMVDRVVRCEQRNFTWHGALRKKAIMPSWSALMISRSFSAALIATAVLAASPVLAKSKTATCTDDGLAKADAAVMKMADGENKTMAMQELTSAKSSMSQKDMAGCSSHMSKAMKMTTMKPKKM
jgi:anti-sigma-K factor RskA